jgi:hypothetical protein
MHLPEIADASLGSKNYTNIPGIILETMNMENGLAT